MLIAIASEDDRGLNATVAAHFGRCPYYTLVEAEQNEVKETKVVNNPFYAHHVPGQVPVFIRSKGVDVMMAGGMGPRAIALFEQYGIEVVTGAEGSVDDVVRGFLSGDLSGTEPCDHTDGSRCQD
jgi:predicted Fe-Mo cluster-binding NifX family protein